MLYKLLLVPESSSASTCLAAVKVSALSMLSVCVRACVCAQTGPCVRALLSGPTSRVRARSRVHEKSVRVHVRVLEKPLVRVHACAQHIHVGTHAPACTHSADMQ